MVPDAAMTTPLAGEVVICDCHRMAVRFWPGCVAAQPFWIVCCECSVLCCAAGVFVARRERRNAT
jgi:hypothetical protein